MEARTKLACKLANLEPQKLNEAVHFGHLNCVPETKKGSARKFDENGILMLSIYSHLLNAGINSEKAGDTACSFFNELMFYGNDCEYVRLNHFADGGNEVITLDPKGKILAPGKEQVGRSKTFSLSFHIGAMRKIIEAELERISIELGGEETL